MSLANGIRKSQFATNILTNITQQDDAAKRQSTQKIPNFSQALQQGAFKELKNKLDGNLSSPEKQEKSYEPKSNVSKT